jgi:tetratricopeptide (TPR) repeat protein
LGAFLKVCYAVAYAHARGVVHRDLKPENIILGGFGEVIVLDWGLAKLVDQPEEETGAETSEHISVGEDAKLDKTQGLMGTPPYMAPEQVDAKQDQIDCRTDVYALGAILFEILTGHAPAEGTSTAEIFDRIRTGRIPRARQLEPSVPRALEAVCAKAMALDRSGRYPKASDLADDVRRWLAGERVRAYQETWMEQLARWSRRHRSWVQAGAAAVLLVAVVSSAASWLIFGAWRREHSALVAEGMAKDEARMHFTRAHVTVRDFTTQVSRAIELKRNLPGLQKFRGELMGEALKYYRDFLGYFAQNPILRAERAEAYYQIGKVTSEIGSESEAVHWLEEAEKIQNELSSSWPNDSELIHDLALTLHDLGRQQLVIGRTKDAERSLTRARDLRERLTEMTPDNSQYLSDLAGSIFEIGGIEGGRMHRAAAEGEYARAGEILKRIVEREPENTAYSSALARVWVREADLQSLAGRRARSEADHLRARKVQQKLVDRDPHNLEFQRDLAVTNFGLAILQATTGRGAEAGRRLVDCRDRLVSIIRENPDVPSYLALLSSTAAALNLSHMKTALDSQTGEILTRARDEVERLSRAHPENVVYRSAVGLAYMVVASWQFGNGQRGDAEASEKRACEIHDELVKAHPNEPMQLQALGSSLSSLSMFQELNGHRPEAAKNADRAITIAEQLVALGPENVFFQQGLASAYFGLSLRAGRSDAEQLFEKGRSTLERLTRDDPDNTTLQSALASAHMGIGALQFSRGNLLAAQKTLGRATEVLERILALDPDDATSSSSLGTTVGLLATVQANTGHGSDAEGTYGRAIRLFEDLSRRSPSNRNHLRFLCSQYLSLAVLQSGTNRYPPAEENYQKAREVAKRCLALDQNDPDSISSLLSVDIPIASLFIRERKHREAEEVLREAQTVAELLLKAHPDRSGVKGDLGAVYLGQGQVERRLGRETQASKLLLRARDTLGKAVDENSADPVLMNNLAIANYELAWSLRSTGRSSEAEENYEQASRLFRTLMARKVRTADYRHLLYESEFSLGVLHVASGRLESAERHFVEARTLKESMLRDQPNDPTRLTDVCLTWGRLGDTIRERGRLHEAESVLLEAIKRGKVALARTGNGDDARAQLRDAHLYLARVYRALGLPAKAAAATLEREKLYPEKAFELYGVGCSLSLCVPLVGKGKTVLTSDELAERKRYADLAVEKLRKAIRLGFNDVQDMKKTEFLDPIRSREEFQALLLDAAFPADCFAR